MNIGIIGAGKIAAKMAETIRKMDQSEVCNYAIASRDKERAQRFASYRGFQKAYGSYEELVQDPNVDLIYIATPHSHHFQHAKLCIEHQKPVLCEKPFTANAKQAQELLALAKKQQVFIAEAAWTRYMPSRKMISDLVDGGAIGLVTALSANIGYPISHIERLHSPALAGGALLDLGVYPIHFASMVFGDEVAEITVNGSLTDTGVDEMESMILKYRDGRIVSLFSTMLSTTDRRGIIYGDRGYIEVDNINNVQEICVYNADRRLSAGYEVPAQLTGYEYEVLACKRALDHNLLECPEMPHSETIRIMKLLDQIRATLGVKYPFE